MSLICWKSSRPTTSSATSPDVFSAVAIIAASSVMKRVAVGKAGERIVFRQISDPFGFALSHRYVAQDRAILKAVGALPAGETGLDRKHLAVLAQAVELQDQAARLTVTGRALPRRSEIDIRRGLGVGGANPFERLADHFRRVVAEDRSRAGIPHRDPVLVVGADQAVAERHRDALKAALGDAAQQSRGSRSRRARWRPCRRRSRCRTATCRE